MTPKEALDRALEYPSERFQLVQYITDSEHSFLWASLIGYNNLVKDKVTDPYWVELWNNEFDHDLIPISEFFLGEHVDKQIESVSLSEEETAITFKFIDDTSLVLIDDLQICCEERFMRTDDDLESLKGSCLKKIIVKDVQVSREEKKDLEGRFIKDEQSDVQFLEIITNKGSLVFSSHIVHNGCYGRFNLKVKR